MVEKTKFDIIGHNEENYKYLGEVTAKGREGAVVEHFKENLSQLEEVSHVLVLPQEAVKNYRTDYIENKIEEMSGSSDTEENKEEQQEILFGG